MNTFEVLLVVYGAASLLTWRSFLRSRAKFSDQLGTRFRRLALAAKGLNALAGAVAILSGLVNGHEAAVLLGGALTVGHTIFFYRLCARRE